jgi:hypothetical protein
MSFLANATFARDRFAAYDLYIYASSLKVCGLGSEHSVSDRSVSGIAVYESPEPSVCVRPTPLNEPQGAENIGAGNARAEMRGRFSSRSWNPSCVCVSDASGTTFPDARVASRDSPMS